MIMVSAAGTTKETLWWNSILYSLRKLTSIKRQGLWNCSQRPPDLIQSKYLTTIILDIICSVIDLFNWGAIPGIWSSYWGWSGWFSLRKMICSRRSWLGLSVLVLMLVLLRFLEFCVSLNSLVFSLAFTMNYLIWGSWQCVPLQQKHSWLLIFFSDPLLFPIPTVFFLAGFCCFCLQGYSVFVDRFGWKFEV